MFSSTSLTDKTLTNDELSLLEKQNSRLVPEFKVEQLEKDAKRHWDLFYKRNEGRFFRDRHWTTREFTELLGSCENTRTLLEIGCGVGNFVFPLIEDGLNLFIYACDFSQRAVDLVKTNKAYNESKVKAFQCDITSESILTEISQGSVDIVTMIFVLSAINPSKFDLVLKNLFHVLRPGGVVLFRDYGLYDMAQLRFKPGHKIADNFYMRQDGTRSYYFSVNELSSLFERNGFKVVTNEYVHRRTVNKKEGIDVPRIFVQGKFQKETT